MKKIFAIILLATVFISACKKTSNNPAQLDTYSNALEYSIQINEKYREQKEQSLILTSTERSDGAKAAVTVMTDVAAAGTAAKTMGSLWLAAPWGTIAASVITVCAGAASSVLAHDTQKGSSNSNGKKRPISTYEHANSKLIDYELELDSNPFGNPYDSLGFKHNELVKRYYTTPDNYDSPNPEIFIFNPINLIPEENNALADCDISQLVNLLDFQYSNPTEDSASLSIYLNEAYILYGSNQFLIDFNIVLLLGMYNCTA